MLGSFWVPVPLCSKARNHHTYITLARFGPLKSSPFGLPFWLKIELRFGSLQNDFLSLPGHPGEPTGTRIVSLGGLFGFPGGQIDFLRSQNGPLFLPKPHKRGRVRVTMGVPGPPFLGTLSGPSFGCGFWSEKATFLYFWAPLWVTQSVIGLGIQLGQDSGGMTGLHVPSINRPGGMCVSE